MNHSHSPQDTSIQANLRRQALNKKASHRNWREWDAMYDAEVQEKESAYKLYSDLRRYLPWFGAGMACFGVSIGLCLALLIMKYVG